MKVEKRAEIITKWIDDYCKNTSIDPKSLVVGISGGIDSALVSTLCAMTGLNTVILTMPIKNSQMDLALKHCDYLKTKFDNIHHHHIDLTSVYNAFEKLCNHETFNKPLGFANSKSRIRMIEKMI